MRQNILTLGEQVEIVNADLDHNFNEMIFDDAASLIGYKVPSRNGIARVTTHHDRSTVQHQIRQFDDDFMDLIQPSTGTMSPQSIAQAREDVVKSIDTALEQLETLDASISTLPTDARLPHITRGLTMAVAWHGSSGQTREDGRTPFWVHPFRTMERVRRAVEPFSASLAVGALLHDVVEDTTASISEIHEAFGEDVAQIVQALTRREGMSEYEYLAQLAAGPIESRIVKLADRLDNVLELSEMRYSTFGRRTPQDYLNSSEEVLSACKQANPALASELASAIAGARHAFG
jgi:GTP pyrophosphokinase